MEDYGNEEMGESQQQYYEHGQEGKLFIKINIDLEYDQYGQEMPQIDQGDGVNALNLRWVMGFNKDID